MNSSAYQSILDEGLRDIYGRDSVLMHDGAPCHHSVSTQLYLERKKICYISDWPPQSPDLNIIENMWSVLKRNVSKRFPHIIEELWEVATKKWYIKILYASIPRRLDVVRKLHGAHSKYWDVVLYMRYILIYKYIFLSVIPYSFAIFAPTFLTMTFVTYIY